MYKCFLKIYSTHILYQQDIKQGMSYLQTKYVMTLYISHNSEYQSKYKHTKGFMLIMMQQIIQETLYVYDSLSCLRLKTGIGIKDCPIVLDK